MGVMMNMTHPAHFMTVWPRTGSNRAQGKQTRNAGERQQHFLSKTHSISLQVQNDRHCNTVDRRLRRKL